MARQIKYTIKVDTNVDNVKKNIQDSLDKMRAKVNVTAEVDKVVKPKDKIKLDAEINPASNSSIQQSAQKTGRAFGQTFASIAVVSALASGSWQALGGMMQYAVGSYNVAREAAMSRTLLSNSLNFRERNTQRTRETLAKPGNYEEKAAALGIDLSKAQEAIGSATTGTNKALDAQEKHVRDLTNAHEDQIDVLDIALRQKEKELEALKQKNKEEIKAQQQLRGLNTFNNESNRLDQEITRLNINKATLELQGENTIELDEQIGQLELQKELQDENIDLIDLQVKKYEDAAEVLENDLLTQIRIIKSEIEDKRLQMDIDVAPAQKALERLKSSMSSVTGGGGGGGGITDSISQDMKNFLDKAIVKNPPTQAEVDVTLAKLYKQYEGFISKSTIDAGLTDLLMSGLNAEEAGSLFSNLTDAAAGTQGGSLTMTEKLKGLTEAYRQNNSKLSQNKGLNENFISDIIPKGTELLIQQALAVGDNETALRLQNGQLTEAEENMAKFEGTMFYTQDTMGTFSQSTDKMGLDRLAVLAEEAQIGLGNALTPAINQVAGAIAQLLIPVTDFIEQNPELVANLFGALGSGVGITAVAGTIAAIAVAIAAISWPIVLTIGAILVVAGLIGGAFALLGQNWEKHGGPIEESLNEARESAKKLWEMFSSSPEFALFKSALEVVGDLLVRLIFNHLKDSVDKAKEFYDLLIKAGEAWGTLKDKTNQGLNFVRDNMPMPQFADGGYVRGVGTGTSDSIDAKLSNGEFVVRADAVRALGRSTMEMINNVTKNTSNVVNNYTTRNPDDYVQI